MKFPFAVTGGTAPSASSVASVAVTYPGVRGSRTGAGGRFAGACAAVLRGRSALAETRVDPAAGFHRENRQAQSGAVHQAFDGGLPPPLKYGGQESPALQIRQARVGVAEPIERDAHPVHDPEVQAAHLAILVAGAQGSRATVPFRACRRARRPAPRATGCWCAFCPATGWTGTSGRSCRAPCRRLRASRPASSRGTRAGSDGSARCARSRRTGCCATRRGAPSFTSRNG